LLNVLARPPLNDDPVSRCPFRWSGSPWERLLITAPFRRKSAGHPWRSKRRRPRAHSASGYRENSRWRSEGSSPPWRSSLPSAIVPPDQVTARNRQSPHTRQRPRSHSEDASARSCPCNVTDPPGCCSSPGQVGTGVRNSPLPRRARDPAPLTEDPALKLKVPPEFSVAQGGAKSRPLPRHPGEVSVPTLAFTVPVFLMPR